MFCSRDLREIAKFGNAIKHNTTIHRLLWKIWILGSLCKLPPVRIEANKVWLKLTRDTSTPSAKCLDISEKHQEVKLPTLLHHTCCQRTNDSYLFLAAKQYRHYLRYQCQPKHHMMLPSFIKLHNNQSHLFIFVADAIYQHNIHHQHLTKPEQSKRLQELTMHVSNNSLFYAGDCRS